MAGELDLPEERSFLVEEAHFAHPEIEKVGRACFGAQTRSSSLTQELHRLKDHLKERTREFIQRFDIKLLVIENALAIAEDISV